MPSISDVFNQLVEANGTLTELHADVQAGTTATEQVKTSVDQVNTTDQNGFTTLDNDLNELRAGQQTTNLLLEHISQQEDTIICILDKIAHMTADIANQEHAQTRLLDDIDDDVDQLVVIEQTANPGAALEYRRSEKLWDRLDECCPPKKRPPDVVYEPCPRPKPINRDQPQAN